MDNLINKNLREHLNLNKGLVNDIRSHELKTRPEVNQPTSVTYLNVRGGEQGRRIKVEGLYVLLDSGCSDSLIRYECVKHLKHKFKKNETAYDVAGGAFSTTKEVKVKFSLPQFTDSKIITHKFQIDESENTGIGYDAIIGRDLLSAMGINLNFKDEVIEWDQMVTPMKNYYSETPSKKATREELRVLMTPSEEPIAAQQNLKRANKILDASYEKADLRQVVQQQESLSQEERNELYELLDEHKELFDGTLGDWKTKPVDFELRDDAQPHSSRYYPMARIHKDTFKTEIKRLVKLGVLEEVRESEWGSPTFIIAKKNGSVRFLSDFRVLNTKIKRKPYPLPKIGDVLQQLEGFQYATTLDLNMGYYTVRLSPEASDMCTIVTEFGKFRYLRLPMGVSCSPDIFQSKINELLGDLDYIRAYLDDVLVLSKGTFTEHLQQVRVVLQRFQRAGLRVNIDKSSFGISEVEYLGYLITKEGIKPDPKKVQGIVDMARPTTSTEIRRLVGLVQYYRDLWPRRSHVLAPLTEAAAGKAKRAKIKWTEELERAFQDLKKLVAKDTMLNYPDWSKPFEVHTDASDFQLGAVISQNNKPIAFFSRKLNTAQKNYTTTEKELLSIVECLKQFRNILFGYEIIVWSDHKNLVHAATVSESQRVMRWRLLLEEFGPDIRHIAGVENIVADAISRLPMTHNNEQKEASTSELHCRLNELFIRERNEANENGFPLDLSVVQQMQQIELQKRNSKLKTQLKDKTSGFAMTEIDEFVLLTYQGRIYVPQPLRGRTLSWYHHYLSHPGGDRLANTLSSVCYWKGMTSQAKGFCKKCGSCQKYKKRRVKYGKMPPKTIKDQLEPWHTVHVDLIGPYNKKVKQQQADGTVQVVELQLTCMTFIDPATGWFEMAEVPYYDIDDIKKGNKQAIDKTSARISLLFDKVWLSRYPRPSYVVFDNGSEFKKDFIPLLRDFAIKPKLTTIKNPQSNAPVERIHQVIGNMFITQDLDNQVLDLIDPWGPTLNAISWAIRASHHSTLDYTPCQAVFQRDMIFNIKTIVNWKEVSLRKQAQVDRDNQRENKKRVDHDYQVGEQVYITKDGIYRKLDGPKTGPYPITNIFTNGTVRIQRGIVNERINIRRLEPHFE